MNNKTWVPATFEAETRFELRPNPVGARETEFEQLKNKLLAGQLAEIPAPELNAALQRAANEAAALAWTTIFPLLAFPLLFEEKTAVALRQAQRQSRIFENSRDLVAA
ncbi:MAG TPA: hypothetical protein VIK59_06535 [Verrucomicrobiae bacterium]